LDFNSTAIWGQIRAAALLPHRCAWRDKRNMTLAVLFSSDKLGCVQS
jgi:hypothetical protein